MHNVRISDEVLARIRQQRGELHMFDQIDPRTTAHIVVDLQNGFMEPGAPVEVPAARQIVGNVNSISAAMRQRGGHNVFLRMTVNPQSQASWSNWFRHSLGPNYGPVLVDAFAENAHYWQLWPQLQVLSGDAVLEKTRFSAFVPGASGLHEHLQQRHIDTLIVTGTLSNCCCESTARDAMQMNYKIVFVADANAALSDAAHNATLENMAELFADVMTTREVLLATQQPHRSARRA